MRSKIEISKKTDLPVSNFNRDKCRGIARKLRNKIEDRVANYIYHYSDVKGFQGIIKSNEIWMTNATSLNDETDLRNPFRGEDVLGSIQFKNPDLFDALKKNEQALNTEQVKDYYLASFSKNNNSLDQFRAYGNYCCIGFDTKKLRNRGFQLFRCVYEQKDIKKWIIRKDSLSEWQNECFNNPRGERYRRFSFYDLEFAKQAKFKNKHYESEKEIRLLVTSNSSWGWCTNSPEIFCNQPSIYSRKLNKFNAPVPYVKFFIPKKPKTTKELEKLVKNKSEHETKQIIRELEEFQGRDLLPINEVVIGPMQLQEETVIAIQIFLQENGYDKVNVIASDIPYRG